jgi:hypothetical protein
MSTRPFNPWKAATGVEQDVQLNLMGVKKSRSKRKPGIQVIFDYVPSRMQDLQSYK